MSLSSELVIADAEDVAAIADSDSPASQWDGICFTGLDNIKLCTLLSLLRTGSIDEDYDRYMELVTLVSGANERPSVFLIPESQVEELATIASLENEDFEDLLSLWSGSEELEGWTTADSRELLRSIGDLAETAKFQSKVMMLWIP